MSCHVTLSATYIQHTYQAKIPQLLFTQVSPLKYPGTLLYLFVGGGEIFREGGYYYQASSHYF